MEAHDGTLAVRSRSGGGTTFTIRLPSSVPLAALHSSDLAAATG